MSRIDTVTEQSVPALLVDMGLAAAVEEVAVETLTGGVSSSVLRADVGSRGFVIKQALPELRVKREWHSDPHRSRVECRAAKYLAAILPGRVPAVISEKGSANLFVMEAAPRGSATWKAEMLSGRFDESIAGEAGTILATIHESSLGNAPLAAEFENKTFFRELRVDPYIREVGRQMPALTALAEAWARRLEQGGSTFVHADFSPKNILITPDRVVLLIDHEVAHWGDPSFDLAFFMTHLLAKSLRSQEALTSLKVSLERYQQAAPRSWALVEGAGQLVGLMMMARVRGKSPLEYLSERESRILNDAAMLFALTPPITLDRSPHLMHEFLTSRSEAD